MTGAPLPPATRAVVDLWRPVLGADVMQDIKELGRRAGDQTLFAEKVRDMLQHLDIDIGLEDELEQDDDQDQQQRSEENTSELQSLMRISYAVFCLNKKKQNIYTQ